MAKKNKAFHLFLLSIEQEEDVPFHRQSVAKVDKQEKAFRLLAASDFCNKKVGKPDHVTTSSQWRATHPDFTFLPVKSQ